ncbi:hypothetical protein AC579_1088 [Pseudocercospora musae]|uniref:Uncharacterized protein n=1 Tax=Pseudocercospora musae TaxID=113226 RepID=A0A139H831_9PEZI|nr:hypothetical protein AC579_1088 [Pseudocercospora musae]
MNSEGAGAGAGARVVGSLRVTKVAKNKAKGKAKAKLKNTKTPKHLRPLPSDPLSRLNTIVQRLNLPAPTVHLHVETETRYRITYVVSKNPNNRDTDTDTTENSNKENIQPPDSSIILFQASGDMCATRNDAQISSATKILPSLEALLLSSADDNNTPAVTTPAMPATSKPALPSTASHNYQFEEDELDWDMDSLEEES